MSRSRPTIAEARRMLKHAFGLDEFGPGQAEIVESVLERRDTLAIMPRGTSRSSLHYEIPALLLPGTTVVVSPTISSTRDARKLVLTTPERLVGPGVVDRFKDTQIDLVVIDEAQRAAPSRHDFRPVYLEVRAAIRALGGPPVLALTTGATSEVVREVLTELGMSDARVINASVFRPNLYLEAWRSANEPERRKRLTRLLAEIEGAGIVYAATVRQVDVLHDLLVEMGFDVAKHHGRMTPKQRNESQHLFATGKLHAIVATNAYGMGTAKRDIRFVIHYAMPKSLESYYQEARLSGRDGRPARCALLFRLEDRPTHLFFEAGKYPPSEEVHELYAALSRAAPDGQAVPVATLKADTPNVADAKVRIVLQLLKGLGVAKEHRGAKVSLITANLSRDELDELATGYQARHAADAERFSRVIEYCQSARCRWKLLLDYFGEDLGWERCEHCDNCRNSLEDQIGPPGARSEAADQ